MSTELGVEDAWWQADLADATSRTTSSWFIQKVYILLQNTDPELMQCYKVTIDGEYGGHFPAVIDQQ